MFLIWSGWGILVLPIVVLVAGIVTGVLQAAFAAGGHAELAFLAISIGGLAAAAVNWIVGTRLNNRPGRELLDPKTNERVILRRTHRLFWIKMQYWSIPVAIAALVPLLALRNLGA